MFVRDFLHVEQPFERVAPRFVADTSWLVPLAVSAVHEARIVAGTEDGAAERTSDTHEQLATGRVRARFRSLLVPFVLVSDDAAVLPDLAGDLEVTPLDDARTLLVFGATYRRPARNASALERVERATEVEVRGFLRAIARALEGDPTV